MYETEKQVMLETCAEMLDRDLVVGSSGNVSLRVKDHVIITPSGVEYRVMTPYDLIVIDLEGNKVEGKKEPSIETEMHLEVYGHRGDIGSIVHTHSVYATAMALLYKSLPPIVDELVPTLGGKIAVTDYSKAGTRGLAQAVADAVKDRDATLIGNHGALCVGNSLREALDSAILLERACKIYMIAAQVGKPSQLPEDVVTEERHKWVESHQMSL
ncbi:MAG: class II aldolase/adducin family protein [Candidatus Lokiarchaeota archaeon]|nr:class II aldolase/adducin family protein [Candidatus Lokiarchaeota archaeon]